MVDTNVLGVALSIRAALGHFREQNRGHMLLTSSVAGRRALPGSLYSATKWAVTRDGRGAPPGGGRHGHQGDPDRARDGRHAVLRRSAATVALEPDDIARAVMFALTQPAHVDVNEMLSGRSTSLSSVDAAASVGTGT